MTNGYALDGDGNQTIATDALGHFTTNVFARLNRIISVVYVDG